MYQQSMYSTERKLSHYSFGEEYEYLLVFDGTCLDCVFCCCQIPLGLMHVHLSVLIAHYGRIDL